MGSRWLGGRLRGPRIGGAAQGALPIAGSRRTRGSELSGSAPRAPLPSRCLAVAAAGKSLLRCGAVNVAGLTGAERWGTPEGEQSGILGVETLRARGRCASCLPTGRAITPGPAL